MRSHLRLCCGEFNSFLRVSTRKLYMIQAMRLLASHGRQDSSLGAFAVIVHWELEYCLPSSREALSKAVLRTIGAAV